MDTTSSDQIDLPASPASFIRTAIAAALVYPATIVTHELGHFTSGWLLTGIRPSYYVLRVEQNASELTKEQVLIITASGPLLEMLSVALAVMFAALIWKQDYRLASGLLWGVLVWPPIAHIKLWLESLINPSSKLVFDFPKLATHLGGNFELTLSLISVLYLVPFVLAAYVLHRGNKTQGLTTRQWLLIGGSGALGETIGFTAYVMLLGIATTL